jgi:hypothetical protein
MTAAPGGRSFGSSSITDRKECGMSTTSHPSTVDLAARPARPVLALVLALLSVPGSLMTWDVLPGGGFVWGAPLAIVAIVLGVQARGRSADGRGLATAAVAIAAVMLAVMVVWTVVETLA